LFTFLLPPIVRLVRFEKCLGGLDYALVIAEMVNALHDTHVYVQSTLLKNYIGTHVPPMRVKYIEGRTVVFHVFKEEMQKQLSGQSNFDRFLFSLLLLLLLCLLLCLLLFCC